MTLTTAQRRPSVAARRFGYGVTIVLNAAVLAAVNVWPGWQIIPFLTADMVMVLPWMNASIIAGVVANTVYLVDDRPRLRALGNVVTTLIGAIGLVRMWQVFPFDFGDAGFDWALVMRVLLALGLIGSVIAIVASIVTLVSPAQTTRCRA